VNFACLFNIAIEIQSIKIDRYTLFVNVYYIYKYTCILKKMDSFRVDPSDLLYPGVCLLICFSSRYIG